MTNEQKNKRMTLETTQTLVQDVMRRYKTDVSSGKADKATTIAGYGITNAYTKTEIDNMIGNIETLLAAI